MCKEIGLNVSSNEMENLEKQFDAIVSFEVFEHLDNISYFFENATKLLEKGH